MVEYRSWTWKIPENSSEMSRTLIGYHIGTMNDYPAAQCLINESRPGYAAYGSYGIGEDVGASMSGITTPDYPTTPDRVLKGAFEFRQG